MSKPRTLVVVALTALLLANATPAWARQLDARDEPEVSAQLTREVRRCHREALKNQGQVVVRFDGCIYFYSFDPLSEIDLVNDYGVVWLQVNVDAAPGWCTTNVDASIELPGNVSRYGQVPSESASTRTPVSATVELPAEAGGNSLTSGYVRQRLTMYPSETADASDDEVVGLSWNGETTDKLAFVLGVEIGWSMLDPIEGFSAGLRGIRLSPGC